MKILTTKLDGVLVIEPTVFQDDRGYFIETYNARTTLNELGIKQDFVQDNHSRSLKGVLRGMHYQIKQPQGKLVRVSKGIVYDVAVDLRQSSPTFKQWEGIELSEDNHRQIWIPPGFAHGFVVLSKDADFMYKTTDFYAPEYERCIAWNDPSINIEWPIDFAPIVSAKDMQGMNFEQAEVFES